MMFSELKKVHGIPKTATVVLLLMVCVLAVGSARAADAAAPAERPLVESLLALDSLYLALVSLVCGYVDSTIGMGYGTTLSPILVSLFGYDPHIVVPALLFSQFAAGIAGGIAHHKVGNVSLTPGERPFSVVMVLAASGIGGAYVAGRVAGAIPSWVMKLLISLIVLSMGVLILLVRNYRRRFSWRKIVALGAVASFNKVISGGGYGPVIVAGQIVSGVDSKNAIGITALAEGLTCISGVITYYVVSGVFPWSMSIPLTAGALVAVPLAVVSVKLIPAKKFTHIVGAATLILGVYSVYKCWPDVSAFFGAR